MRVRDYY